MNPNPALIQLAEHWFPESPDRQARAQAMAQVAFDIGVEVERRRAMHLAKVLFGEIHPAQDLFAEQLISK